MRRLTDPLEAARQHRAVLPYVVVLLVTITFSLAFFAERLQRDPDVRDLLPRRSTLLLLDVRPGDSAAMWKDQPAMRSIRAEVERLYARHGIQTSFDTEHQGGGLIWIARPTGVAEIAYCRCTPPPSGSRTVMGFTFVSDDAGALLELAPPAGATVADDPQLQRVEPLLPGGAAVYIVAQPNVALPLLSELHAENPDVNALLERLPMVISTWQTIVAVAHTSDGAAAVTLVLPHRMGVQNEPLVLVDGTSMLAIAHPQRLLLNNGVFTDEGSNPNFLWSAGAPPLYRAVVESSRVGVALTSYGIVLSASRPIGWSTERALIDAQLRAYVRSKTAIIQPLPLPGGGASQERIALPDADLPTHLNADGSWSIQHGDAAAAARVLGPRLELLLGSASFPNPPAVDAAQQRVLRAQIVTADIPVLTQRLAALAPPLRDAMSWVESAWREVGLTSAELDVGVTGEQALVRVRWRSRTPVVTHVE